MLCRYIGKGLEVVFPPAIRVGEIFRNLFLGLFLFEFHLDGYRFLAFLLMAVEEKTREKKYRFSRRRGF